MVSPHSLLTDFDISLFNGGKHFRLYEKLGSHIVEHEGTKGVLFAVWAPNASQVSVIGNFNGWQDAQHKLYPRLDGSGIWEGFIANIGQGEIYKYKIHSHNFGQILEKTDPFAFFCEVPPNTASVVWDLQYAWKDNQWMKERPKTNALNQPFSVYELHIGSWKRNTEEGYRSLHYTELAEELTAYVKEMGFTHIEFMPVMEHPFFGSWGYQSTGYFAPSSRYGTPQEFMQLVDKLHENGIGVILDWVPSHFPTDAFSLSNFDGTALYEHGNLEEGFHPDWKSFIFNYGRYEVRSFLISSAMFWCDVYHADGLRVDAVASMLYRDYSRKEGEWRPNIYGGRENLEAISFLREMNEALYANFEGIQTIAEESTAFSGVSRPVYIGGLGFGMKWMMGWMHDTLKYFKENPLFRRYHHGTITFSLVYAFSENFMLPLSHDEVVHGKGPLLDRMPGDEWQRMANLRAMYGYMFTHPGTKLLFMGGEFGQPTEWQHDHQLPWHLLQQNSHKGVAEYVKALNKLYRSEPALYEKAFDASGFEWIEVNDYTNSVITYIRRGNNPEEIIIVACNLTPVPRENYRFGVPETTELVELLNSDAGEFWGSNYKTLPTLKAEQVEAHGREFSVMATIPPLATVVWKAKVVVKTLPQAEETKSQEETPKTSGRTKKIERTAEKKDSPAKTTKSKKA
ncbi:MAG: 1,4-alpha-glucan branching protein GlgB [Bacteroidetes bacterium]|nr:MAG: 1,4-alpha-glucan branching protein GlgB [Bacteroidota bacterium]